MIKKGEIAGFQYEILHSDNAEYISEYDVHFFTTSKVLQFTFESDHEGASNRFSLVLTDEQCKNFNVDEVCTVACQIIDKFLDIAYSKSRIKDEIECIQKNVNKYDSSNIIKSIDDFEYEIIKFEYYNNPATASCLLAVQYTDDIKITVKYDFKSSNFTFSDWQLIHEEVQINDKQLYIEKIHAKLGEIFNTFKLGV